MVGRINISAEAEAVRQLFMSLERDAKKIKTCWFCGFTLPTSKLANQGYLTGNHAPHCPLERSEDIGNADPRALLVATAAAQAVEHVGLPECQFALAQAAIYLSLAPKSDAVKRAVFAARDQIRERGALLAPAHLRSSIRSDGEYDNPHRRPGHLSRRS